MNKALVGLGMVLLLGGYWAQAAQMADSTVETVRKQRPFMQEMQASLPVAEMRDTEDASVQIAKLPVVKKENYVGIGYYSESNYWYEFSENVDIQGPLKLVYYLSHSPTLCAQSTLTVWFNDEPLESVVLGSDNVEKNQRSLIIPSSKLRVGANSLKFRAYAVSNAVRPCEDMSNPANWAVVHKDSYLEVRYRTREIEDLHFFPQPYVNRGILTRFPLGLVFPDQPDFEELRTMALLVQYFGALDPFSYDRMNVFLASGINGEVKGKYNLISLGDLDRNVFRDALHKIPQELLGTLDDKKGVILKTESEPSSGKTLTVVSSRNSHTLYKVAQTLTYPSLVEVMKGPYAVIDTSRPLPVSPQRQDIMNPTFETLHFPSKKITGIFEVKTDFLYKPPMHWGLLPGTGLVLNLSYSPLLDPDASIISVVINDRPIQSFKLKGKDGIAQWTIRIPDDMLSDPELYVVLITSLALQNGRKEELWCMDAHHDKAWVIVHDNSYFHTPHVMKDKADFSTFPSVFLGDAGLRPIRIVLPDHPSVKEYNTAFNMVYAIASQVPSDKKPCFEILQVSEVTQATLKEFDLILVGSIARNKWLEKINSGLPLPFHPETGKPTETRIEILPEFLKEMAVLELAPSPWNSERNILVISSPFEALLELASTKFLNLDSVSKWHGNITLINAKDQSYSYQFGAIPKVKKTSKFLTWYLPIWITTTLALVVVVVMILYRRHKYGLRNPLEEP